MLNIIMLCFCYYLVLSDCRAIKDSGLDYYLLIHRYQGLICFRVKHVSFLSGLSTWNTCYHYHCATCKYHFLQHFGPSQLLTSFVFTYFQKFVMRGAIALWGTLYPYFTYNKHDRQNC